MARIAALADLHLANHANHGGPLVSGINMRATYVLRAMDWAYEEAERQGCETMVICGDVFDTARPTPQLIRAAQQILRRLKTIVLTGNHDIMSSAAGDHALGPLEPVAEVVEQPRAIYLGTHVLLAVPFQTGRADEWLPKVVEELANRPHPAGRTLLALHLGVRDGKTPPWLADAHDSVPAELLLELAKKHDIDGVFAGNWHEPNYWSDGSRFVCQVGCLAPTGWDNPGPGYGRMVVWDTRAQKPERINVPGPRFLSDPAEAKQCPPGCALFIRTASELDDKQQWQAIEHEEDTSEAQVALRQAAGLARAAGTIDDAVAQYVGTMPLEDETIRPAVLEAVKGFIARGAAK